MSPEADHERKESMRRGTYGLVVGLFVLMMAIITVLILPIAASAAP
jgi:hypothetical protein